MSRQREQFILISLICATAPTVYGQCSDNIYTSSSGTIYSNRFSSNYPNSAECSWIISLPSASSVTLSFSAFETEAGRDFVRIYSCSSSSCLSKTQIGNSPYSGTTTPSSVTSYTGIMLIEFSSDSSITRKGFTATYTSGGSAGSSGTSGSYSSCQTGQYRLNGAHRGANGCKLFQKFT